MRKVTQRPLSAENKNCTKLSRARFTSSGIFGLVRIFPTAEVVCIQKLVRFALTPLEFSDSGQKTDSENRPDRQRIGMLLPNPARERSDQIFTVCVGLSMSDLVQQTRYTQTGRFAVHARKRVFDSAVGIMQLENELVTPGNIRREITVA